VISDELSDTVISSLAQDFMMLYKDSLYKQDQVICKDQLEQQSKCNAHHIMSQ